LVRAGRRRECPPGSTIGADGQGLDLTHSPTSIGHVALAVERDDRATERLAQVETDAVLVPATTPWMADR
jgi:hypothetical protein